MGCFTWHHYSLPWGSHASPTRAFPQIIMGNESCLLLCLVPLRGLEKVEAWGEICDAQGQQALETNEKTACVLCFHLRLVKELEPRDPGCKPGALPVAIYLLRLSLPFSVMDTIKTDFPFSNCCADQMWCLNAFKSTELYKITKWCLQIQDLLGPNSSSSC